MKYQVIWIDQVGKKIVPSNRLVAAVIFLLSALICSVSRAEVKYDGGQLRVEAYENFTGGKLSRSERALFEAYLLGMLTAIEAVIADQREGGGRQTFCPPDGAGFRMADLHAMIQLDIATYHSVVLKSESPLGWAATRGYRRAFPCPATGSGAAVTGSMGTDAMTIRHFNEQYGRSWSSAEMRALGTFALGFRDGIDGMQTEAVPIAICMPLVGLNFGPDTIQAIRRELRNRPDYWADRQDQPVGRPGIIAVKKLYPCKR